MRFDRPALPKLMVQVAVCGALMTGTYLLGHGASKDEARLLTPQDEGEFALAAKGDRLPVAAARVAEIDVPLQEVEVASGETGKAAAAAVPAEPAPAAKGRRVSAIIIPTGVERFDDCHGTCDTRDPMIVASAAPLPVAPPVPPTRPARARTEETFLGLPMPSAQSVFDKTVHDTNAALGKMKQAMQDVFN